MSKCRRPENENDVLCRADFWASVGVVVEEGVSYRKKRRRENFPPARDCGPCALEFGSVFNFRAGRVVPLLKGLFFEFE